MMRLGLSLFDPALLAINMRLCQLHRRLLSRSLRLASAPWDNREHGHRRSVTHTHYNFNIGPMSADIVVFIVSLIDEVVYIR